MGSCAFANRGTLDASRHLLDQACLDVTWPQIDVRQRRCGYPLRQLLRPHENKVQSPNSADFVIGLLASLMLTRAQAAAISPRRHLGRPAEKRASIEHDSVHDERQCQRSARDSGWWHTCEYISSKRLMNKTLEW